MCRLESLQSRCTEGRYALEEALNVKEYSFWPFCIRGYFVMFCCLANKEGLDISASRGKRTIVEFIWEIGRFNKLIGQEIQQ